MRLVVSAFEPFGGRAVNRSLELLRQLSATRELEARVLPVSFAALSRAVDEVAALRPRRWLMLGESGRAQGLTLEARAVNDVSARIADNAGAQPQHAPVEPGPEQRESAAPIAALVDRLLALQLGGFRSTDAGRFACNAAYYLALARLPADAVLFVHVPHEPVLEAPLLRGLQMLVDDWGA